MFCASCGGKIPENMAFCVHCGTKANIPTTAEPPPPEYHAPPGQQPPPGYHAPPGQQPPPGYHVPPEYQPPPGYHAPAGHYPPPGYHAPPGYHMPPKKKMHPGIIIAIVAVVALGIWFFVSSGGGAAHEIVGTWENNWGEVVEFSANGRGAFKDGWLEIPFSWQVDRPGYLLMQMALLGVSDIVEYRVMGNTLWLDGEEFRRIR